MNSLVRKIEERLLPDFEKAAENIKKTIPDISVQVSSSSTGSLTELQGHDFWIECMFTDVYRETDNIALGVCLCHITTVPRIEASVAWGNPSNYTEAEFYEWHGSFTENGLKVSEEVLENLYNDLPRLYKALFEALKRRKPGNE